MSWNTGRSTEGAPKTWGVVLLLVLRGRKAQARSGLLSMENTQNPTKFQHKLRPNFNQNSEQSSNRLQPHFNHAKQFPNNSGQS